MRTIVSNSGPGVTGVEDAAQRFWSDAGVCSGKIDDDKVQSFISVCNV